MTSQLVYVCSHPEILYLCLCFFVTSNSGSFLLPDSRTASVFLKFNVNSLLCSPFLTNWIVFLAFSRSSNRLFALTTTAKSPAKATKLVPLGYFIVKILSYSTLHIGPNADPCGTPHVVLYTRPIFVFIYLFDKCFWRTLIFKKEVMVSLSRRFDNFDFYAVQAGNFLVLALFECLFKFV